MLLLNHLILIKNWYDYYNRFTLFSVNIRMFVKLNQNSSDTLILSVKMLVLTWI